MTIVLAITAAALFGLLVYREWAFICERDAEREFRAALERQMLEERQVAATERKELYQRIQAPEIAVHEVALEARRERPYVRREPIGADNDAAFNRRAAERRALRDAEVNGG